jgi:hypothetical protein
LPINKIIHLIINCQYCLPKIYNTPILLNINQHNYYHIKIPSFKIYHTINHKFKIYNITKIIKYIKLSLHIINNYYKLIINTLNNYNIIKILYINLIKIYKHNKILSHPNKYNIHHYKINIHKMYKNLIISKIH